MSILIRLTVDDRHGVLDRITGVIRRAGWNITSINSGEIGGGYSYVNFLLEDRGASVAALEKSLSKLDCVKDFQESREDSHFIRELLLLKVLKDRFDPQVFAACRLAYEEDGMLFLEYSALPGEIDALLKKARPLLSDYARTGVLSLRKKEEDLHERAF